MKKAKQASPKSVKAWAVLKADGNYLIVVTSRSSARSWLERGERLIPVLITPQGR